MKDSVGNEIKVGDLVALQLQTPVIKGRVVEIKEGGIITGTKQGKVEVRPAEVVISAIFPVSVDPYAPVGPVMCLREDNPPPGPVDTEQKQDEAALPN